MAWARRHRDDEDYDQRKRRVEDSPTFKEVYRSIVAARSPPDLLFCACRCHCIVEPLEERVVVVAGLHQALRLDALNADLSCRGRCL